MTLFLNFKKKKLGFIKEKPQNHQEHWSLALHDMGKFLNASRLFFESLI